VSLSLKGKIRGMTGRIRELRLLARVSRRPVVESRF
jgi:hypothetical protein